MWRPLGIRCAGGKLLHHLGPCSRKEGKVTDQYICRRPGCHCVLDEAYYVNKNPALLNLYKLYEVKPVPMLRRKRFNDPEAYFEDVVQPVVMLYLQPVEERRVSTTSEDYVALEEELRTEIEVIDMDTKEVLIERFSSGAGHNPVAGVKCARTARATIEILDFGWFLHPRLNVQCYECNTREKTLESLSGEFNKRFVNLEFMIDRFGLDRPVDMLLGSAWVSTA